MTTPINTLILTVPLMDTVPAVAPVMLSACLNRENISAKGIDFNIEFCKEFSTKPYWASLRNQLILGYIQNSKLPKRAIIDILKFNKKFLLNLKKEYDPVNIGLSIFSVESLNYSYILIYSIQKYLPDVKIILGGKGVELVCSHRNIQHAELFYNNGLADLVVLGDCEHVIAGLIKNNEYGIYKATAQTVEDLDARPLPNWDDYDLSQYKSINANISGESYMVVSASKGCIRKCTFCDVASFWPKYIYRDPQKVADEIVTAYKKTGTQNFWFSDNLINGSVSHYRKINEIIVKEIPNTIKYIGYAIFRDKHSMPESDFELAARAGCKEWVVGVESGSERVRFEMGKKITDDDLDWAVRNLLKYKISQRWLLIVGYPTETDEDFQLTLDMIKRYSEFSKTGLIHISAYSTFELLKNSPLLNNKKLSKDLGLEHNVNDPWHDKFWTSSKYPDNTFPVRAQRWRDLVNTIEECGYPWNVHSDYTTQSQELAELENLYNEKKSKIIPINKI